MGLKIAQPDTVRARLAVCETCDVLIKAIRNCNPLKGGCGCFVDAKARLASESCPIGKWRSE